MELTTEDEATTKEAGGSNIEGGATSVRVHGCNNSAGGDNTMQCRWRQRRQRQRQGTYMYNGWIHHLMIISCGPEGCGQRVVAMLKVKAISEIRTVLRTGGVVSRRWGNNNRWCGRQPWRRGQQQCGRSRGGSNNAGEGSNNVDVGMAPATMGVGAATTVMEVATIEFGHAIVVEVELASMELGGCSSNGGGGNNNIN